MNTTPDWMHGGHGHERPHDSLEISLVGVIAWIAAIAILADALYLAQRFWG